MNYLPNKLVKLRKHYNYPQSYVAKVLDVDAFEYMNYENGAKIINYEQAKKLSSLYHISFYDIFKNSDDVELAEIELKTDEMNIAYFIPKKTIIDKTKDFIKTHKIVSAFIFSLLTIIVILSLIITNKGNKDVQEIKKENINRLSVSETTVIYIDDFGGVHGSGSNNNCELNNLTVRNAIKVQEGEGFSVILSEDGLLYTSGLLSKYENKLSSFTNIIDIAAGKDYVAILDNNNKLTCIGESEACKLTETKNVSKIFAASNGLIILNNDGSLSYSGNFIGTSSLKNFSNIIDVASSDNLLVILDENNKISVYAKSSDNYLLAEKWNDIVDVACGNDFVAGLDKYGRVHIEIENDQIIKEVEDWSDIIAIDAGSNYLIGFDGKKIYGVGQNNYNQFENKTVDKQRLEQVSNVKFTINEDNITVQFDGVKNATAYIVSLDVGTGLSHRLENEEITKFETANMVDGKTYTISIVSVGSGNYKDSDPYEISFSYEKVKPGIEVNITQFLYKSRFELEAYLQNIGVNKDNIEAIEVEQTCKTDEVIVTYVLNAENKKYTEEEINNIHVEYGYCKVNNDEETDLDSERP